MATTKEQFMVVFEELVAELVEDLRAPELGMPEDVCRQTREVRRAQRARAHLEGRGGPFPNYLHTPPLRPPRRRCCCTMCPAGS